MVESVVSDTPLWVILVVDIVVCSGAFTIALSPATKAATEAAARENARNHRSWWLAYGLLATLSLFVLAAMWVWHAVDTGNWLYAAIGLVPMLVAAVREPIRNRWIARARRDEHEKMAAEAQAS